MFSQHGFPHSWTSKREQGRSHVFLFYNLGCHTRSLLQYLLVVQVTSIQCVRGPPTRRWKSLKASWDLAATGRAVSWAVFWVWVTV